MTPDRLYLDLQRHLTQLDYIKLFSLYIKNLVENDQLTQLDECMENRGRLINLTSDTQNVIQDSIEGLGAGLSHELKSIIKSWSEDTIFQVQTIEQIDQEINGLLFDLKDRTTKQISHLFKSRESFKGYNLKTTKR